MRRLAQVAEIGEVARAELRNGREPALAAPAVEQEAAKIGERPLHGQMARSLSRERRGTA